MIVTVSIITLLITLCVNCLIALRSDVKRNYRKKRKEKKPLVLTRGKCGIRCLCYVFRPKFGLFSSQDVSKFAPFFQVLPNSSDHELTQPRFQGNLVAVPFSCY